MQALLSYFEHFQVIITFIGLIVLFTWESLHPFFNFFDGSLRNRGIHYIKNISIGVINALLVSVFFVGLWLITAQWAYEQNIGILNWINNSTGLPLPVHALLAVLLFDCWSYWWHRLNHNIKFFWRFHLVHHSDPHMDVSTANRFHLGEIFFSSLFRIPVILLTGIYVWEILLYESLMFAVVQFHHADINLPDKVDAALRTVIVTPAMHKVHHSRWRPETDSNYSSLFSFWDRIFRSFRLRQSLHDLRIGLDAYDDKKSQTFTGMLKMPFVKGNKNNVSSGRKYETSKTDS